MKYLIFTILTITLITATSNEIAAKELVAPSDTIATKSAKCIFEMDSEIVETVTFANIDLGEFVEESSKPTPANLKPLPTKFSGYKVQIIKVYNQPLDEMDAMLFEYKEVMIERIGESHYAYLVGNFDSKDEAITYIAEMSNKNMKLVKYKNGIRLR